MKNNCENPEYDVTQGQIICSESEHFNKIVGEALSDEFFDESFVDVEFWLASLTHKGKRVQVHLKVTADPDDFIDEN